MTILNIPIATTIYLYYITELYIVCYVVVMIGGSGVEWSGVEWSGVEWCDKEWCGVVGCGV